ncbi:MAG: carboxypeptidase-like regulatory domain-containing protein [Gammaproteobacteria bacterium]|nr:carboxypeptidase-like regulatory domain-containing protein [Gammaproteobacteria bacterium]
MNQNNSLVSILILMLICFSSISFAQTTGKIAGQVLDKNTREPLPGANVIIDGTSMGAATDSEGRFFIINVQPGIYNVKASMIGYGSVMIQNIRVSVNSTTNISFELNVEVIQGEEIVVTADPVAIKKDQTSSVRTVATEELEILPVENINEVVNMQAGVVAGHFRGGRNTEVSYMIDGMVVDNSFNGTSKSTEVDVEVVKELEVITGTFNAEYGRAMSGIVNVVTKEGSSKFGGSFSGRLANYFTQNNDVFIGLGEDDFASRNLSQDYKVQLEGPVFTKKLSFLVNYRYQNNNGPLNGVRLFQPTDYSEYLGSDPELWHKESTGDSAYVSMQTSQSHNLFGKLTFKPINNINVGAMVTYNDWQGTGYSHSWKYNPDPLRNNFNQSLMGALTLNHMISPSLFYDLKLSYNTQMQESYFYEDPLDSRYISPEYVGKGQHGFVTGGMASPGKPTDIFSNLNLKLDAYWQVGQHHGLKAGALATTHTIERDRIDVRNIYEGSADELVKVEDPVTGKIDFPNYELQIVPKTDETLDVYTVNPQEISAYIQDKMEYDELVLNLGVRFDYH